MTTFTPNNKWNISNEYIDLNKDRSAKFSLINNYQNKQDNNISCDFIPFFLKMILKNPKLFLYSLSI